MKKNFQQAVLGAPLSLSVVLSAVFAGYALTTHASPTADAITHEGETPPENVKRAIAPIVFRDGSTHMRVLDKVGDVAISEGDIIFGEAKQYFSQSTDKRAIRGLSNYVYGVVWPNGVVPYRISTNLSDAAKEKVREAIVSWNSTGAVTLIERTTATASAYPNYIDFVEASQCASWVGYQNNGPQSIYTGDKCSTGSMIHEIGHALGLLHEHTRPDRDNFIQINWNSIAAEKSHNFDILGDAIPLGEYDYDSIMHYGTHFFSTDGTATITALQNAAGKIGQRDYISDGDKNSMIELYQSEYSLVASSSTSALAGDSIQLDMYVTNNSDMGANSMRLETTVPEGTSLISFSSPSWACQQVAEGDKVVCLSPVLSDGQNSDVSVSLSAPKSPGEVSFETTLSANTFDTDQSNNVDTTSTLIVTTVDDLTEEQRAAPAAQPTFAAATNPEPTFAAASPQEPAAASASSGGGAFGALGLLLLLARRRT